MSCYYYCFLELLAVKTKIFNRLLLSWRKPVFLNEVKMAKVSSKDNVLLIGAGIFPTETIIIAEETGAHVVGVDNSPNAVKLAKKYVEKQGLSDLISIEYADGGDFSVEKFNVVFIAINVFPINGVLKHLAKTLKKGSKVMCKSIKHDIPDVLEIEGLKNIFEIKSIVENPRSQSYLIIKKQ